MSLSTIQKFGMAALSLATVFGASQAQALDVKPSPDGKYDQCIQSSTLKDSMLELNQRLVAKWNNGYGILKGETYKVKAMVTMEAGKPFSHAKWVRWQGWDANKEANGENPSHMCVANSGTGVVALDYTRPEAMPDAPFGYSYNPPNAQDVKFFKGYARAAANGGKFPAVILKTEGQKEFVTIYTDASGIVDGTVTKSSGLTTWTIDGSNFEMPQSIKQEIALNKKPVQTASLSNSLPAYNK